MEVIGIWFGAFLTLGIISFLYGDNPWYKICEAIFVGSSAGYWFITLFWDNSVAQKKPQADNRPVAFRNQVF